MLGIFVVIVAMAYLVWVGRRATRLDALGVCVRCGRNAVAGDETSNIGRMCGACAETTRRNHRAGFLFFVSLPVIGLVALTVGLISDRRAGFDLSWTYIPIILMVVALPLVIAAFIRRSGDR